MIWLWIISGNFVFSIQLLIVSSQELISVKAYLKGNFVTVQFPNGEIDVPVLLNLSVIVEKLNRKAEILNLRIGTTADDTCDNISRKSKP